MSSREGRRGGLVRLGFLLVLIVGGLLAARFTPLRDHLTRDGVLSAVEGLRGSPWAPLVFITAYATATALAIPGTILTLAGGALFGFAWGTVYNSIAANIGANLAFLVASRLGRDGVRRLAGDRLDRLDEATRKHGFRGLLTLRLIPLVPFNALNFGSGLAALPWPTYALATLVGIFPGTVVYTLFADALLEGSTQASREAFIRAAVAGLLLVLLSFLPTLLRKLNVKIPGSLLLACLALLPSLAAAQTDQPDLADPEPFDAVLAEVVSTRGVDYALLEERRAGLDGYLEALARVSEDSVIGSAEAVQLAFWINAYNACMLRLVVDHYPIVGDAGLIQRLRNVVADRPANSVWQIRDVFTREHCEIAGRLRSQDQIEHEILRPMGEPRIHFAVNCAALSCPPLRSEAYRAELVDQQLDDQVRRFADDPNHLRFDEVDGRVTLRLNRVLDWFGEDFGGSLGLRAFLSGYLADGDADLLAEPSTEIAFFEYDWTLNDSGT